MRLETTVLLPLLLALGTPSWAADRNYNAKDLAAGRSLFLDNCAECHGANAEGTVADWQRRDAKGDLPPPPLDGTAHAWHHSAKVLFRIIREGTAELGGTMPAWNDKLSDNEIVLIINWITSLWPDEIYDAWMQRN